MKNKRCERNWQHTGELDLTCIASHRADVEQSGMRNRMKCKRLVLLLLLLILLVMLVFNIRQTSRDQSGFANLPKNSNNSRKVVESSLSEKRDTGRALSCKTCSRSNFECSSDRTPILDIPTNGLDREKPVQGAFLTCSSTKASSDECIDLTMKAGDRMGRHPSASKCRQNGTSRCFSRASLERMVELIRKNRGIAPLSDVHKDQSFRKVASSEHSTAGEPEARSANKEDKTKIHANTSKFDTSSRVDKNEAVGLDCQSKVCESCTQNPIIEISTGDMGEISMPSVMEKLEHVERHFNFRSFIEDPLACINSLESGHVFEVTSIPRPILAYIARKRCNSTGALGYCREQVKRFWNEFSGLDAKGRRYSQIDMRKSFGKWKSAIKETIRTGGRRIATTEDGLMDRVAKELLGPWIGNILFVGRDGLQNESTEPGITGFDGQLNTNNTYNSPLAASQ